MFPGKPSRHWLRSPSERARKLMALVLLVTQIPPPELMRHR